MDDATYAGLRAALAATPSNVELLKLLAPVALQRGEAQALLVWLEAAGEAGQRPELLIARARALSALYRSEEALRAYERAGFRVAESVCQDIGAGFVMDDFVMRRPVTASD